MSGSYSVAGTSRLNGVVKVRFANNIHQRSAILRRGGHTEINLKEFPQRHTKLQLCEFLINHPAYQDAESQDAICKYVANNVPNNYETFRSTIMDRETVAA